MSPCWRTSLRLCASGRGRQREIDYGAGDRRPAGASHGAPGFSEALFNRAIVYERCSSTTTREDLGTLSKARFCRRLGREARDRKQAIEQRMASREQP